MSVTLRELASSDMDIIYQWRTAAHVADYMYSDHEISPEEHERWFSYLGGDPTRKYWMIENEGVPVGVANLIHIHPHNSKCSWAFYLGEPNTRGAGIGAAVEIFILDYVFEQLELNKLCCEVFERNEAVWQMHQKFGFTQEGLLRDHVKKDDEYLNVVVLGMTRADWLTVREEPRIKKLRQRLTVREEAA